MQVSAYTGTRIFKYTNPQIQRYGHIQIARYSNTQVKEYVDTWIHECKNISIYRYVIPKKKKKDKTVEGRVNGKCSLSPHLDARNPTPFVPIIRTLCSGSSHLTWKEVLKNKGLEETIIIIRYSIVI